eukprot:2380564-Rhodomonas_salina.1
MSPFHFRHGFTSTTPSLSVPYQWCYVYPGTRDRGTIVQATAVKATLFSIVPGYRVPRTRGYLNPSWQY